MAAIIADFGKNKDGLNLLRINGSKDEIEKALTDIKNVGCEIYEVFDYEKAHKQWSILVKINIPEEEKQAKEN